MEGHRSRPATPLVVVRAQSDPPKPNGRPSSADPAGRKSAQTITWTQHYGRHRARGVSVLDSHASHNNIFSPYGEPTQTPDYTIKPIPAAEKPDTPWGQGHIKVGESFNASGHQRSTRGFEQGVSGVHSGDRGAITRRTTTHHQDISASAQAYLEVDIKKGIKVNPANCIYTETEKEWNHPRRRYLARSHGNILAYPPDNVEFQSDSRRGAVTPPRTPAPAMPRELVQSPVDTKVQEMDEKIQRYIALKHQERVKAQPQWK